MPWKNDSSAAGIKTLRKNVKMTQKEFADHFEIPLATLQDWEHGRRKPPKYVTGMMEKILAFESSKTT